MDHWRLEGVHVYHDPFARKVHVSGEVFNNTGAHKRIIAILAVVQDRNRSLVSSERVTFLPGNRELLLSAVSVADGRGLPFGFVIDLPETIQLTDDSEIVIHVAAEDDEPTRDDLDIPVNSYDLSEWPTVFVVSGVAENPGPDLTEFLMIVATVYDTDGRVIASGWRSETDSGSLSGGRHEFEVEIQLPEPVADLNLKVGSYKLQLFGR